MSIFAPFVDWQVVENEITVSKGGFATVEVEQTVPMGCNDPDSSACNVDLNLFDPNLSQNPCDAGISAVNADDDDMCANVIKVMKATKFKPFSFILIYSSECYLAFLLGFQKSLKRNKSNTISGYQE